MVLEILTFCLPKLKKGGEALVPGFAPNPPDRTYKLNSFGELPSCSSDASPMPPDEQVVQAVGNRVESLGPTKAPFPCRARPAPPRSRHQLSPAIRGTIDPAASEEMPRSFGEDPISVSEPLQAGGARDIKERRHHYPIPIGCQTMIP